MKTRREFLGQASCSAVGSVSVLSSLLNLKLIGSVAAAEDPVEGDYKALVCVFLEGGQDSFNMLTPRSGTAYDDYAFARRHLATPQEDLLPVTPATDDGREYGLHPNLGRMKTLFDNGDLSFLANVGTLVAPMTLAEFQDGTVPVPRGLFSHADQARHWQSSLPDRESRTGWVGRAADILQSLNDESPLSMNISIGGANSLQIGESTEPYVIGRGGSAGLTGWGAHGFRHGTAGVTGQLELDYQNLFEQTFAARKKNAIETNELFRDVLNESDESVGTFSPHNPLAAQLKVVAQTIAGRAQLGVRRQVFFVKYAGWDHHKALLDSHPAMLSLLDEAIWQFNESITAMGLNDQVTAFTASDFGRSLTPNGDGTDHAWGGNQFMIGGAVRGGDIFGSYPELRLFSDLDVGRGRFIPTTSVDEYFAELSCWFGISATNLPVVLPNITRFHDPNSQDPPIGFLDLS